MSSTRLLCLLLLLVCTSSLEAQHGEHLSVRTIDSVIVTASRRLAPRGTTLTRIDTVLLRESVVSSVADILARSTSIFIKSYGRGTMATASFRGTSPSHTLVHWNGLKLNSPMLGQVDFSLIPAFMVDEMTLWHGASSTEVASGGLGGGITLVNSPIQRRGHSLHTTHSLGSYATYDGFVRYSYGGQRWSSSTRLQLSRSANDFEYRNLSKVNLDDDGSIRDEYEISRNRNSNYRDLHLMQELYYSPSSSQHWSLLAWLTDSDRGVPMLLSDQRLESQHRTQQSEQSLRSLLAHSLTMPQLSLRTHLGYTYTHLLYTYRHSASGVEHLATSANSYVHSLVAASQADYQLLRLLSLGASLELSHHSVDSWERITRTGYPANRLEAMVSLRMRWRPVERASLSARLRRELHGRSLGPLLASAFGDYLLVPRYGLRLKGSIGYNYRVPTLNDLYFQPGGNSDLKPERSLSYDLGLEGELRPRHGLWQLRGEATVYNSYIKDWILWLPTFKGYWTPLNVRSVHNYGLELKAHSTLRLGDWHLRLDAGWSYNRAVNRGDRIGSADRSQGEQLAYTPERLASLQLRLSWHRLLLSYKYHYYSERYTTTASRLQLPYTRIGAYHMSDLALEYSTPTRWGELALKVSIHNLLDEEYVSVLSRPMPRRHYSLSVSFVPRL